MSSDETIPPRQPVRFVPTLTEIVAPLAPDDAFVVPPAPAIPSASDAVGSDVLVVAGLEGAEPEGTEPEETEPEGRDLDDLLHRLGPELDVRLSETIAKVMEEQIPVLNARIRQALADVVRQTVAEALAAEAARDGASFSVPESAPPRS